MPSYGEKQMPAGVDKSPAMKPIDNCMYKGNAALNANKG
jgi:hypothetical protein